MSETEISCYKGSLFKLIFFNIFKYCVIISAILSFVADFVVAIISFIFISFYLGVYYDSYSLRFNSISIIAFLFRFD